MSGLFTAIAIGGSALIGAAASSDSSKRAANTAQNTAGQQMGATATAQQKARGDLFNLFPSAEANSQKGYQSALDVFGQFMPQQADTFQQGNMAAQNQILAGMPQAHNALMGGAVDYSQFQPAQIDYDPSMFQQQLPEYQTIDQAMDPTYGMTPEQIQAMTAQQPQQGLGQQGWQDIPPPTDLLSGKGFVNANRTVIEKDPVVRGLKKLFSDIRLKTNVVKVGEIAGLDLCTWVWMDSEVTHDIAGDAGIGFIADEVEKIHPHAVVMDSSGYKKIIMSEIFKESI